MVQFCPRIQIHPVGKKDYKAQWWILLSLFFVPGLLLSKGIVVVLEYP